jgi:hypothetical protein
MGNEWNRERGNCRERAIHAATVAFSLIARSRTGGTGSNWTGLRSNGNGAKHAQTLIQRAFEFATRLIGMWPAAR